MTWLLAGCVCVPGEEGGAWNKSSGHLGVRFWCFYAVARLIELFFRRVTRPHGNSGVVKSKFKSNLPPHCFGASVRVVSTIANGSRPMLLIG